MKTISIKVNNKIYSAKEGETVLEVCRREGIKIPTLCSHKDIQKKEAVCRLCLVEVEGKLVTSCTTKVKEGLEVITENKKIKKAREINMELLWSDHAGKCAKCEKNKQCELQNLAEEYKIENFHFVPRKGDITGKEEIDLIKDNWSRVVVKNENPVISRNSEYCVECRRCINICPIRSYGFNYKAGDVVVGTPFEEPLDCIFCGACVAHCPTAALTDQGDLEELTKNLDDPNILAIAIIDPAMMVGMENEFENIKNKESLVGLLKEIGFEQVFDLTWGFEKYVKNLAEEIYTRKYKKQSSSPKRFNPPKISSFCPSAKIYIQKFYPELIKYVAKTEQPETLMGKALKLEYATQEKINAQQIFTVLVSSCTARKKLKDSSINQIITVRELGRIVRKKKIETKKIEKAHLDNFLIRSNQKYTQLYKLGNLTKRLNEETQNSFSTQTANGVVEIKNILDKIKKRETKIDFLETMICPRGCENGGGQSLRIK